jgi:hypothetical protein
MQLGDIFYHETDKAVGFDLRYKYHIYICPDDHQAGHTFLFINSDGYPCDFPVTNKEYPFLTHPTSYVCCSSAIFYTDDQIAKFPKQPVGRLSAKHMQDLFNHIQAGGAMVRWQEGRVCNALRGAF